MDDDFNTGGAIGELFELAKVTNKFCDDNDLEGQGCAESETATLEKLLTTLKELAAILGIFIAAPTPAVGAHDKLLGQLMQLLIDLRTEARDQSQFETADAKRMFACFDQPDLKAAFDVTAFLAGQVADFRW